MVVDHFCVDHLLFPALILLRVTVLRGLEVEGEAVRRVIVVLALLYLRNLVSRDADYLIYYSISALNDLVRVDLPTARIPRAVVLRTRFRTALVTGRLARLFLTLYTLFRM